MSNTTTTNNNSAGGHPSTKFGGSVTNSQVLAGESRKKHGGKDADKSKTKGDTVSKTKSIEVDRVVNDAIGASVQVSHGFGVNALPVDGLQSYSIPASGGEKETNDMILYRVGKQLCILDNDALIFSNSVPNTTTPQKFLSTRPKHVKNILHFCLGHGNRHVAVCESTRAWDSVTDTSIEAQVSVYNTLNYHRLKTLTYSCSDEFIQCEFCGDSKYLAAMTGERDRQIIVFHWEKDKVHKIISLASYPITRMRVAPCNALMITTSGKGTLRSWFIGPDGSPRPGHILPTNRESEVFLDHIWLPAPAGAQHFKMIALCDVSEAHGQEAAGASTPSLGSTTRQNIFVLEGENLLNTNSLTTAPVQLELRQAITIKQHELMGGGLRNDLRSTSTPVAVSQQQSHPGRNASLSGADATAVASAAGSVPPRIEAVIATTRGFMLVGGGGFVALYERALDKRESFIEIRRLFLGDLYIIGATLVQGDEKLVVMTKTNRMLTYLLGSDVDDKDGSVPSARTGRMSTESDTSGMDDDAPPLDGKDLAALVSAPPSCHDLYRGGYHFDGLVGMDCAVEKPLLVTIGTDRCLRAWDFEMMACKFVYNFRTDEPLAVAIHPSGFQLVVSFKDRVKQYNVLHDKLKPFKETMTKNCKELRYSNSGSMWAAASSISVVIFDTISFNQLAIFTGHTAPVRKLVWAPGDEVVFSSGGDGNIYGWPISRESRIDVMSANNRNSNILSVVIDCPSLLFPKPNSLDPDTTFDAEGKAGVSANDLRQMSSTVVLSSGDGSIKTMFWYLENGSGSDKRSSDWCEKVFGSVIPKVVPPVDSRVQVNCMHLSADRQYLYTGTTLGSIRVYLWPPANGRDAHYYEVFAHSCPIVSIRESPHGNLIISAGEDGSMFMTKFTRDPVKAQKSTTPSAGAESASEGDSHFSLADMLADTPAQIVPFNKDVVLMSSEEVEDHIRLVARLRNDLVDAQVKYEYNFHEKETEYSETLRKQNDIHEITLKDEFAKFNALKSESDRRIADLIRLMEAKETENTKVLTELENKYEHKIADQMERYDALVDEMEALRQNCEAVVSSERNAFEKKIDSTLVESRMKEKKLKTENRRIAEDRVSDSNAFKEILDQQEGEYERELKELIISAEAELTSERETITKLRTLVQTKITKVDQLKKKLFEVDRVSRSRKAALDTEKKEKQMLIETVEHYKKNLKEREEALMEKEKIIIELRSTTRTLENFRFVLDHRLQQLSMERGPITAHIEGLEKHIATIYEELVDEFDLKKQTDKVVEIKEKRIALLHNELKSLNLVCKQHETLIHSFKRDLGNLVNSMQGGRGMEESVRSLYKKYVRGEKIHEDALKATGGLTGVIQDFIAESNSEHGAYSGTGLSQSQQLMHQVYAHAHGTGHPHPHPHPITHHGSHSKAFIGADHGMTKSQVKEIEEALIESAKEAERQKGFVERASDNLQHRLSATQQEMRRGAKNKLAENSALLFECNNMRKEIKELERNLDQANALIRTIKSNLPKSARITLGLETPKKSRKARTSSFGDEDSSDEIGQQPPITPARATSGFSESVPTPAPGDNPTEQQSSKVTFMPPVPGSPMPGSAGRLVEFESGKKVSVSTNLLKAGKPGSLSDRLVPVPFSPMRQSQSHSDLAVNSSGSSLSNARGSMSLLLSPMKKVQGHKSREEILLSSAGREVEQLAKSLDEAQREREMQRREIARLRSLLAKQALESAPAKSEATTPGYISFVPSRVEHVFQDDTDVDAELEDGGADDNEGEYDEEEEEDEDAEGEDDNADHSRLSVSRAARNLTTADRTGRPSEQDILDLALAPVSRVSTRS